MPEAMNVFLDRYGILDADYERAAQTTRGSRLCYCPTEHRPRSPAMPWS